MELRDALIYLNPHWKNGYFYKYEKERKWVAKLKRYLHEPIIKALVGPRRVGKSVILKQLINHLMKEGVERKGILYYSFEEGGSIWEVLKAYKMLMAREPSYLFLDEVQYAPRWKEELKRIYDMEEKPIIISGSVSLALEKGRESLAGRMYVFKIGALSFEEYLSFTGSPKAEYVFQEFLTRQLPYLALHPEAEPYLYLSELVKKAIHEDSRLLGVGNTSLLESIFRGLMDRSGQIVIIEDLAQEYGASRPTISRYLQALEWLALVRKVYNYRGSRRKSEVKAKKFYPFYSMLAYYGGIPEIGLLYESYVAESTQAEFFWRKGNREIDFYFPEEKMAIEVKAKTRVRKRELSTLCNTKLDIERRIVVVRENTVLESPCEIEKVIITDVDNLKK
ncbi:MAG: ATP-binding protein [Candidatus Micrarchaeota archaeon]|nr:ATP-binding protein [Candidatus Micrarchaeota archaeon]